MRRPKKREIRLEINEAKHLAKIFNIKISTHLCGEDGRIDKELGLRKILSHSELLILREVSIYQSSYTDLCGYQGENLSLYVDKSPASAQTSSNGVVLFAFEPGVSLSQLDTGSDLNSFRVEAIDALTLTLLLRQCYGVFKPAARQFGGLLRNKHKLGRVVRIPKWNSIYAKPFSGKSYAFGNEHHVWDTDEVWCRRSDPLWIVSSRAEFFRSGDYYLYANPLDAFRWVDRRFGLSLTRVLRFSYGFEQLYQILQGLRPGEFANVIIPLERNRIKVQDHGIYDTSVCLTSAVHLIFKCFGVRDGVKLIASEVVSE